MFVPVPPATDQDTTKHAKDARGPSRPLASRESRLVAVLVDVVVGLVLCGPGLGIIYSSPNQQGFPWVGLVLLIVGALVLNIIQWTLLAKQGQTIGKNTMNVRIVRYDDNSNPGFLSAVVLRSMVPGLIIAIPCVGVLFTLVDILWIFGEERRCLHDCIAGTKVVEA